MRAKGYYWVKVSTWVISYWNGESWNMRESTVDDDYFSEIDETKIVRDDVF